jgi:hypothetical protein
MARYVTISSIAWGIAAGQTIEDGLRQATDLLRLAAVAQPDLILFPELFLHAGQPIERWCEAGPLPNAFTDHFGALAREYGTNLVIPIPTVVDGRCYNSAVVLDRRGAIVGKYDKVHPTIGEMEKGITPGAGPVVHELDFGRIAHAICYDVNFPHQAEALQKLDVNLICYHSMFTGGQLLNHWALMAGAYLVSAYEEDSRVVDMTGHDLMSIGRRYEQFSLWKLQPIMTARLNFDRQLFHVDYNAASYDGQQSALNRLLAERAHQVTVDHNFPASVFALGALDGVTVPELCAAYGLQPRNAYFRQSAAIEAEMRARLRIPV